MPFPVRRRARNARDLAFGSIFALATIPFAVIASAWSAETASGNDGNAKPSGTAAAVSTGAGFDTTSGTNLDPALVFGTGDETLILAARSHIDASGIADGGGGSDVVELAFDSNLAQLGLFADFEILRDTSPGDVTLTLESGAHGLLFIDLDHGGVSSGDMLRMDGGGTTDFSSITLKGVDVIQGDDTAPDTIVGTGGGDVIDGRGGDDILDGGPGADSASGGNGSDRFPVRDAEAEFDEFDGGAGTDLMIRDGGGAVRLDGFSPALSIEVIDGRNRQIEGNAGANLLDFSQTRLDRVSFIDGGSGDDVIHGWTTGDDLRGGAGADSLFGNDGDDRLRGGSGEDLLEGGVGHDTIDGELGNDVSRGDGGNDIFLVRDDQAEFDTFGGGTGTDRMVRDGGGAIRLDGFSPALSIEVVDGLSRGLEGNARDNLLDFSQTRLDRVTHVDGGEGEDVIHGSAGGDALRGGAGSDRLFGEGGDDTLVGGAAGDELHGGGGRDTLDGGPGIDAVVGGSEGDTFLVRGSEAEFDEFDGGAGTDLMIRDGGGAVRLDGFSPALSIEVIDGRNRQIEGNAGANLLDFSQTRLDRVSFIDGGSGDDVIHGWTTGDDLRGGAGADTLVGGPGSDVLSGGAGFDRFPGAAADLDSDAIADMERGDAIVFTSGLTGTLDNERIAFNSASGALVVDVDADGIGAGTDISMTLLGLSHAPMLIAREAEILMSNSPGPDLQSVTSADGDGLYGVGDAVHITARFDESVDFLANGGTLQVLLSNGEAVTLADNDASGRTSFSGHYDILEGQSDSPRLDSAVVSLTGGATLTGTVSGLGADLGLIVGTSLADNHEIAVDANTPAVQRPDLTAGSDTGNSDSDDLTNAVAPTIAGSTEAEAAVDVRVDGTVVGTTTAGQSGAWSFTLAEGSLSEGPNVIDVIAADTAGNTSAPSIALTITHDTVAPSPAGLIVPSVEVIRDSEVGPDGFSLTVDFDEPMNTNIDPTIVFPTAGEDPTMSTLLDPRIDWVDGDTFTVTYDVAAEPASIEGVDVQVSGAQDAAGNTMIATTQVDAFSIFTEGLLFGDRFEASF